MVVEKSSSGLALSPVMEGYMRPLLLCLAMEGRGNVAAEESSSDCALSPTTQEDARLLPLHLVIGGGGIALPR